MRIEIVLTKSDVDKIRDNAVREYLKRVIPNCPVIDELIEQDDGSCIAVMLSKTDIIRQNIIIPFKPQSKSAQFRTHVLQYLKNKSATVPEMLDHLETIFPNEQRRTLHRSIATLKTRGRIRLVAKGDNRNQHLYAITDDDATFTDTNSGVKQ